MTGFVPGCRSAWDHTLDALGRFYERVQILPAEQRSPPPLTTASPAQRAAVERSDPSAEMIGTFLESARSLGRITAATHRALAAETADPQFVPEPATPHSQRAWFQSLRNLTRQNFQLLSQQIKTLAPETQAQAQAVLGLETEILKRFRAVYEGSCDAVRVRVHGNLHLGQFLYTGKEFLIADFEGEPASPLGERRLKQSALRDVAELEHSFHRAAQAALLSQVEHAAPASPQIATLTAWANYWARAVSAVFFMAYCDAAGAANFLPSSGADRQIILDVCLLRRAICDLGHELNHDSGRVAIPLQRIRDLASPANPPE